MSRRKRDRGEKRGVMRRLRSREFCGNEEEREIKHKKVRKWRKR